MPTDGQISTLQFVYSRYAVNIELANGVMSFGMWLPNSDPAGKRADLDGAGSWTGRRSHGCTVVCSHIAVSWTHGRIDARC